MIESLHSSCPYCGEPVELHIDGTAGESQAFVEDCPVCCQPWEVRVEQGPSGEWVVRLQTADE